MRLSWFFLPFQAYVNWLHAAATAMSGLKMRNKHFCYKDSLPVLVRKVAADPCVQKMNVANGDN
jgi:hypothetical protein